MSKYILRFASFKKPNDIFEAVKSGKKTLETRPINPNKSYQVGDELILVSLDTKEKIVKKVKRVAEYRSITEMAGSEDVRKIVPGVKTPEKLIHVFGEFKQKWGRVYAKKIEENGIVVLELE